MPTPIIAAYDPFREDRAPVELAVAFGELTGMPVRAAAVYPAQLIEGWVEPVAIEETLAAGDRALEQLYRDTGVRSYALTGVSVPRELNELARREGSGLIVLGSTGRTSMGRVLPGSTAERVLHGATCAIALAPKGYRHAPIETVAVGFADTPEGHAALAAAHELARRAGARLRAISVLQTAHGEQLERAVAALPPGVEVEMETRVDDPADALLRVSERVDVLVSGSRGYGPLRSVLLGGVSRRLVDGARCPVLVLPRGIERPLADLLGPTAAAAAR